MRVDLPEGVSLEEMQKKIPFLTDKIDAWYSHFQAKKMKIKDTLEEMESIPVKAFVVYDPGEYFIEFDHFLEDSKNQRIRELLR